MHVLCCRSKGTFTNYLGHVKLFCQLLGLPTAAFYDDRLRRAKCAIMKRSPFHARDKMFIRKDVMTKIMQLEYANVHEALIAQLFLVIYSFMLRLPSEALPMVWVKSRPGVTQ